VVEQHNVAYQQYQEAYLQAQLRYNTINLKESSSQEAVNAAYQDWVNKGYKNEVEQAYATIDLLTGRSPMLFWKQLKEKLEQSKLSDLKTNQDFYQTYFYPSNFYKPGVENQWTRLVLESQEIDKLSSNQTDTSADIPVSRLQVDLMRVLIVRPWMNPSLFKSRFWQWADRRDLLSDGTSTPHGSLVAYATAIVFARNLKIELKSGSQIEASKLGSFGPLSLENANVSGSNSIQADGMQILAFICQKLPKSPNPDPSLAWTGLIDVDWFSGQYTLDRNAKISQVKVTIHTGNVSGAGTDANVYFRVNNGDWWDLDKPLYNDFENNATDTYGPFQTNNLTVENISRTAIELRHDNRGVGAGWYVEWLRLEVYVENKGWLTYKQWQPGWLASDEGDRKIYRQLQ